VRPFDVSPRSPRSQTSLFRGFGGDALAILPVRMKEGGGWMSRVKGCYPLQLCGVCRYLPRLLMDGNI